MTEISSGLISRIHKTGIEIDNYMHEISGPFINSMQVSYENFIYERYYVKFEEDKFYQLMCYILIGIIIVLLSTMFALFWFQICCAIIIVVSFWLNNWQSQ